METENALNHAFARSHSRTQAESYDFSAYMKHRFLKFVSLQLSLVTMLVADPSSVLADPNSYATMIDMTSAYQSNLTQQMMNYNRMFSLSSGTVAPPVCLPPYQLQRGLNGVVPPELQGDPRYQEYLRCLQRQSRPSSKARATPQYASAPVVRHQPINISDYVPVMSGHPIIEQALSTFQINPQQRLLLHNLVDEVFRQVSNNFRGNNLAVALTFAYFTANDTLTGSLTTPQQVREKILAVNDVLAQNPNFSMMSAVQKQNISEIYIYQSAMIIILRNMGKQDMGARRQSIELARVVMRQLMSS